MGLEHPDITRMNRMGFLHIVEQPEHNGIDFYGYEILEGERFFEYDGELVHEDNLERFLVEELGFVLNTAL